MRAFGRDRANAKRQMSQTHLSVLDAHWMRALSIVYGKFVTCHIGLSHWLVLSTVKKKWDIQKSTVALASIR